jgi:hypothetical protein
MTVTESATTTEPRCRALGGAWRGPREGETVGADTGPNTLTTQGHSVIT